MTQVSVDEAAANLQTLLKEARNGKEVLIIQDDRPVAKLVSVKARKVRRKFGGVRGLIIIAPDFDLPLVDMDKYSR